MTMVAVVFDAKQPCIFHIGINNQFGATEHAAFYNCTGNEYMANRINKAGLTKGRLIKVDGSFNPREYQTKEGEIRMSLDVGIYCTQMPVDTPVPILERALQFLFQEYKSALSDYPYHSVKRLGERLSWIGPDDFQTPAYRENDE